MFIRRFVSVDLRQFKYYNVTHKLLHSRKILQNVKSDAFGNVLVNTLRYSTVHEKETQQNIGESPKNNHNLGKLNKGRSDNSLKKYLAHDRIPLNNNPDKFGTLSSESLLRKRWENLPEESDDKELIEFLDDKEGKTRLKTIEYSRVVYNFLKEKKLKEALNVLEIRMKEEKAQPDEYLYRLLIAGCAKAGYTKKAFHLFNQMKKRGLKVKNNVYTSLFDACANSPWSDDGIKRASALWDLMEEKRVELNQQIAHAAIKAFGRCGSIERSFSVVDEMSSQEIPITSETINFLLQACASEKAAGFRHALLVWRKMLDKKIIPTTFTYNLLLRCTRDCSIGDVSKFKEDLSSASVFPSQQELLQLSDPAKKTVELFEDKDIVESNFLKTEPNKKNENNLSPNLLQQQPFLGCTVDLAKVFKPWHRLMLLGGVDGFINMMLKSGAEPNIKTFTQLLFMVAPNVQQEQLLITEMKRHGIKVDLDFCNMLIKKRNMNGNFSGAKDVLTTIREEHLTPNIVTFGVLAMGCTNFKQIKLLLKDIKAVGFRANIEILGTLLHSACRSWDFKAIHYVVRSLNNYEIKPNFKFIEHLQKLEGEITEHFERKKNGISYSNRLDNSNFEEEYENFKHLITYVKSLEVDDPITIHPWSQFKKCKEEGPEVSKTAVSLNDHR